MINRIHIKDFVLFDVFHWPQTSGINVILGENDTGKTGLLKLLYASTRAWNVHTANLNRGLNIPYKEILAQKIFNVFQPRRNGIGELVRKGDKRKLVFEGEYFQHTAHRQSIHFSFTASSERKIIEASNFVDPCQVERFNTLFIPPKEVLTAWQAIKSTRQEDSWQFGFDDTYTDLIDALLDNGKSGNLPQELKAIKKRLLSLFDGEVKPPAPGENDFLFIRNKAKYTMGMTAEGIKKMGIYARLINNRNLNANTILFLDEPEAVLHPKAIRQLAEIIYLFSQAGVQIFLNTHSFFLLKQLEIIARRERQTISCCALTKQTNHTVKATFSDLQDGLPDNPIIEEALRIFNEEIALL